MWSYSDNSVTFNFRDQEYIFKSRGSALYDTTNREILKPLSQSPSPSGDGTIELEGGVVLPRNSYPPTAIQRWRLLNTEANLT